MPRRAPTRATRGEPGRPRVGRAADAHPSSLPSQSGPRDGDRRRDDGWRDEVRGWEGGEETRGGDALLPPPPLPPSQRDARRGPPPPPRHHDRDRDRRPPSALHRGRSSPPRSASGSRDGSPRRRSPDGDGWRRDGRRPPPSPPRWRDDSEGDRGRGDWRGDRGRDHRGRDRDRDRDRSWRDDDPSRGGRGGGGWDAPPPPPPGGDWRRGPPSEHHPPRRHSDPLARAWSAADVKLQPRVPVAVPASAGSSPLLGGVLGGAGSAAPLASLDAAAADLSGGGRKRLAWGAGLSRLKSDGEGPPSAPGSAPASAAASPAAAPAARAAPATPIEAVDGAGAAPMEEEEDGGAAVAGGGGGATPAPSPLPPPPPPPLDPSRKLALLADLEAAEAAAAAAEDGLAAARAAADEAAAAAASASAAALAERRAEADADAEPASPPGRGRGRGRGRGGGGGRWGARSPAPPATASTVDAAVVAADAAARAGLVRLGRRAHVARVLADNRSRAAAAVATLPPPSAAVAACDGAPLYSCLAEAPAWASNAHAHAARGGALLTWLSHRRARLRERQLELALAYRALAERWRAAAARAAAAAARGRPPPPAAPRRDRSDRGLAAAVRSDYEEARVLRALQAVERVREMCAPPDQALDAREIDAALFLSRNGLVRNPLDDLEAERRVRPWGRREVAAFLDAYLATPKDFTAIAASLPGRDYAACVAFYYRHQKGDAFAVVRRKQQLKKRRLQTEVNRAHAYLGAAPPMPVAAAVAALPARSSPPRNAARGRRPAPPPPRRPRDDSDSAARSDGDARDRDRGGGGAGAWSAAEEAAFVAGVRTHGRDARAVAAAMGHTRTVGAVKSYYSKNRRRLGLDEEGGGGGGGGGDGDGGDRDAEEDSDGDATMHGPEPPPAAAAKAEPVAAGDEAGAPAGARPPAVKRSPDRDATPSPPPPPAKKGAFEAAEEEGGA